MKPIVLLISLLISYSGISQNHYVSLEMGPSLSIANCEIDGWSIPNLSGNVRYNYVFRKKNFVMLTSISQDGYSHTFEEDAIGTWYDNSNGEPEVFTKNDFKRVKLKSYTIGINQMFGYTFEHGKFYSQFSAGFGFGLHPRDEDVIYNSDGSVYTPGYEQTPVINSYGDTINVWFNYRTHRLRTLWVTGIFDNKLGYKINDRFDLEGSFRVNRSLYDLATHSVTVNSHENSEEGELGVMAFSLNIGVRYRLVNRDYGRRKQ